MCHSQTDDPDGGNVRKHVYSTTVWRDRLFICPVNISLIICLCLLSFCVGKKHIWTASPSQVSLDKNEIKNGYKNKTTQAK